MNKKRGLILAKFAPFHVCHHYIIETALKVVDELFIIMYDCPNLTNIPLNTRAGWVRNFYPQVNVIEGWDAPNRHEDTLKVKKMQEDYVKSVLNGKKITHFFSSDYYGEHMSKALGAINWRVDLRDKDYEKHNLVRATMIRKDKYLYRKCMDPLVYKDVLFNIAFVGMPSKEQSKLVKILSQKLKTAYTEDNLLKFIETRKSSKKDKAYLDFYKFAKEKYNQANAPEKIYSGKEYLLYDSTGFIDHLLSILTHNFFNKTFYDFFSTDMREYDLVFINDPNNSSISKYFDLDKSIFINQLINNLDSLGITYQRLEGSFGKKLKTAENIIKSLKKKIN